MARPASPTDQRHAPAHVHEPQMEVATPLGDAAIGRWRLDATKSSAGFRHKSLWGLVTVRGTFAHLMGDGEILADGSVRGKITIPAASLDTKNAKRDRHLRSKDFFDALAHPLIVFTTTSVGLNEHGLLLIDGALEVGGISRRIALQPTSVEASIDHVTLEAKVEINRADFDMSWNRFGMLRGPATISVLATFARTSP